MRAAGGIVLRLALVPALAVVVLVPIGWEVLLQEEAEHARFYETGSSVKGFLGEYCGALVEAFERGESERLDPFYAEGYAAPGRGRWRMGEPAIEAGVEIRSLVAVDSSDYGPAERRLETRAYLEELAELRAAACKIYLVDEVDFGRGAVVQVRFVLEGADREGRWIEDRHFYRWRLEAAPATAGPAWRIVGDEVLHGTRTAGRGIFESLDPAAAGIDYRHRRDPRLDRKRHSRELKFDVIQHALGGLSAADYDGDGRPDLFFADGVDSRLYRNEGLDAAGRPRFADVTAASGLEGIDRATAALFVDLDNDGDRDLLVARYLAPGLAYENDGRGVFTDVSARLGVDFVEPATSATALDYDLDGDLDLYLGVYGNAFEAFPRIPFYATNGERNRLLRNEGGERFVDATAESGTGDTGWSLAVATGDVNGDGRPDLGVANDFGRKSLYLNNGDGTFSERAREAGVLDFSGGMGLAFGDWDNDGLQDLYTSNIYSNQRWYGEEMTIKQYLRNVLRTKWALLDLGQYIELQGLVGESWRGLGQQVGEGNSVFRNQGDGTFSEIRDTPASFAGWSWGVAFFDADNDADLDLYAANGWISATPYTDL